MKVFSRSTSSFGDPPKRSLFRSLTTKSTESLSASCQALRGFVNAHPDLGELNAALDALAAVFPDVYPEVFREMLMAFSGESRLFLVAEQLLQHKAKWVKDRWTVPGKGVGKRKDKKARNKTQEQKEVMDVEQDLGEDVKYPENSGVISLEDKFRSPTYKNAVRIILCQEFKGLTKSTIDGVLAEQNFSYSLSRPILLGLAAKTWRLSLSSIFSRWQAAPAPNPQNHFMLTTPSNTKSADATWPNLPTLRSTPSLELDAELEATILEPLRRAYAFTQEKASTSLALELNENEAASCSTMYECECCLSTMTFETMSTCTTGEHTICFTCIQRSVSEAMYGQSWTRNIDHTRGQIACIAPTDSGCKGCIPQELAQRAIMAQRSGPKVWASLQEKVLSESLQRLQSSRSFQGRSAKTEQIPLVQCPFCPYAESSDFYLPQNVIRYRLNTLTNLLLLCFLFFSTLYLIFPIIILSVLPYLFSFLPSPQTLLDNAFRHLHRKTHLSPRFACRNPTCKRLSCLRCHKAWRDPHICFESARLSLRTTIEAARTAALKRTCPRCSVAFVKSSGCNKMICVCGYTMCYICRQGLGGKGPGGEDGEGYRHFCQHFRPKGGRCADCDKCDLYKGEDEDEIVKRAGEIAESDWKMREGFGSREQDPGSRASFGLEDQHGLWGGNEGRLQRGVNWWVENLIRC